MNGVLALMKGIYNDYAPTGAYSLEFKRDDGSQIAEAFWASPPEDYSVEESEHASLTKTLSGGYIADHGAGFKNISMSGSLHFYTIMSPSLPIAASGDLARNPTDTIDGLTEFYKLRYLISRYRDYSMTAGGKLQAPVFAGPALAAANAVARFVATSIEDGKGVLANRVQLIWHAYDTDDHYAVKFNGFTASQSSRDVNSIRYSATMEAYQVDKNKSGNVTLGKLSQRDYKAPLEEHMDIAQRLLSNMSPQTKS